MAIYFVQIKRRQRLFSVFMSVCVCVQMASNSKKQTVFGKLNGISFCLNQGIHIFLFVFFFLFCMCVSVSVYSLFQIQREIYMNNIYFLNSRYFLSHIFFLISLMVTIQEETSGLTSTLYNICTAYLNRLDNLWKNSKNSFSMLVFVKIDTSSECFLKIIFRLNVLIDYNS